jgi:hypothetical protein
MRPQSASIVALGRRGAPKRTGTCSHHGPYPHRVFASARSLQIDETIGIYCARLTGLPEDLVMLNNKRPLMLESTLRAGYRLVLHGLSTEMLHGLLLQLKAQQAAQLAQEEGAA